jgi:hypothetical protein
VGDTTNFQITIYTAPKRRHKRILQILEAHDLGLDWSESTDFTTLELGVAYTTNLGHPGEAEEIAAELIAAAPECAFLAWDDPVYEYLGGLVAYTKKLGEYGHSCDADGTPVLTAEEITKLLVELAAEQPKATITDAIAAIAKAAGEPWFKALPA